MLKTEFLSSTKRLWAFYAPPKDQSQAKAMVDYQDSLYESLSSIPGEAFELICKRMVDRLNGIKKPMSSEFWCVHNAMQDEKRQAAGVQSGWRSATPGEAETWCWTQIMRWETWSHERAAGAARFVLKEADRMNVRYPEAIYSRLLEIAGREAQPVESKAAGDVA